MTDRWLRAADELLRYPAPTESTYILAMRCTAQAYHHCDGRFPTIQSFHIYCGICNESLAKENVKLGLWRQAIFSVAEATEAYYLAKRSRGGAWASRAASRGLARCQTTKTKVVEERKKEEGKHGQLLALYSRD